MRHGKKINHLGRQASHRKAMMANMACSLLMHKRISTTLAKAKALRTYVEPLMTKSKDDTTHSRRIVFSYLKQKEAVTALFRDIAPKIADRPGGYTRILKTGFREGDAAEMCFIELVDYNTVYSNDKAAAPVKKTRRAGTAAKAAAPAAPKAAKAPKAEVVAEAVAVEEVAEKAAAKPKKAAAPKAEKTEE